MLIYYINLALILGLGFLLCIFRPAKWKNILYLCITFGFMWFLATFRQGIGFDYQSYIDIFEQTKIGGSMTLLESFRGLITGGVEPGFLLLNRFMSLFVKNSVVMYGVYSFIMLAPVAWFIYRYCKDIWLSTWLYVTLTFFYSIMNFVRQGIACSIILLGYKFMKEKKALPFILIVLLATMFHKTALIMIPIYFLSHIKLTWKMGVFYASATLILYLTSSFIVDIITDYIFKYYKNSRWLTGFPIHFVFVPAIIFGACLALKVLWEKRDPDANMLLNLMMFSFIIWIFITRHFILERFSMYVYIFVLVALPSALSSLKASPEVFAKRDELKAELAAKKGAPRKEQTAALHALNQKISDHKKYYACAVIVAMFVTFVYNDYGMYTNGFHNVFPYQSVFPWLS